MAKKKIVTLPKKVFRILKKLGIFGYSKKNNIFGLNPLVVSTLFIVLILLVAALARKLVKSIFGESPGIIKDLLLEFIATIELCAACFELIIVADNWGISAYATYLFLLTLWWSSKWGTASACPYNAIEEVVEGSRRLPHAILIVLSQTLGGLVTFSFVQPIWELELVETHVDKAFEDCTADLQVDMITGALIEGFATCLCRLVSRALTESEAKLGNILDAFFGTMMVVAAFNHSGGYFNPALATSLKLGCEGNTVIEHVVVYWVGASLGSIASVFLFKSKNVQKYIGKLRTSKID
ncbi:unnamed protein product [Phaedon cochleariae]|uniref:Aquaporin n=1 Tax=Phaedon cochleariae TaxID=80249 RepID=A0A9P0GSP1_PHACE|nr:unnamed protein product [Phaedon cochleariae]